MLLCLIILSFVGCTLGFFFAYDIIRFAVYRFGHVMLRGWKPDQVGAWREKVLSCAELWLKDPPVLPASDEYKYWLVERLRGRGGDASIQGWQLAPLTLGVFRLKGCVCFGKILELLNRISVIDYGVLIYSGMMTGVLQGERMHQVMSRYMRLIDGMKTKEDLVPYRSDSPTTGYSDTLPFLCPALIKYGVDNVRPDLIALGMRQIRHYHDHGGYLSEYGIYAHAYDYRMSKPAESIGWGRGTGWFLLAIIWSYEVLGDGTDREWLLKCMAEAVENILPLQMPTGGWCTQLVRKVSFDSSATVIFAYFLISAYHYLGDDRCIEPTLAAVRRLMCVTHRSGAVDYAEGVCMGIGRYSRRYSISPFAQGLLLCLFASLDKFVPKWERRIST